MGNARATEGQSLLSPLHYLRQALAPSADLVEGGLADVLPVLDGAPHQTRWTLESLLLGEGATLSRYRRA